MRLLDAIGNHLIDFKSAMIFRERKKKITAMIFRERNSVRDIPGCGGYCDD